MLISKRDVFIKPKSPCLRRSDLDGKRFGRLFVLGYAGSSKWYCLCDCGSVTVLRSGNFANLKKDRVTQSCGCLYKEVRRTCPLKNGEQRDKKASVEYRAYMAAKKRCKPESKNRASYFDRGIEFRFESFQQFLSVLGRRPVGKTSLDRIDNNGHYEPGNVRWADAIEQNNNKRSNLHTAHGITKTLKEWVCDSGLTSRNHYYGRRLQGWCEDCALTLSVNKRCKHKNLGIVK